MLKPLKVDERPGRVDYLLVSGIDPVEDVGNLRAFLGCETHPDWHHISSMPAGPPAATDPLP